jgi:hypothetical protein
VDFIVVGGVSAVLQGAPVVTFDLDIVHAQNTNNINALLAALGELQARYRHHSRHLEPGPSHLFSPGHQLLETNAGPLDILGTMDQGKNYEQIIQYSEKMEIEGMTLQVLKLDFLIEVKQRAGRDKDIAVLPVLRNTLRIR